MNILKAYGFYIGCGIVLIIFIVVSMTVKPRLGDPAAANLTPEMSKNQADSKFRNELQDNLERRASATLARDGGAVPAEVLSPESPADIQKLLDGFIVGEQWQATGSRIALNYKTQLTNISNDLADRSQLLNQPISQNTDPGRWYQDYQQETVSLLRRCLAEGLLIWTGETVGAEPTLTDLRENQSMRNLLGLTTLQNFPDSSEYPRIRKQLRIAQIVVTALTSAKAISLPNPMLVDAEGNQRVPPAEGAEGVVIQSWEWGDRGRNRDRNAQQPVPNAQAIKLTIRINGTPSALLAATAKLDAISSPVIVRLGATWSEARPAAGRPEVAAEAGADQPMQLETTLMILDFQAAGGAQ